MQRPVPILWSTLGVLAGFLGAHGIFASFVTELQVSVEEVQDSPPALGMLVAPPRGSVAPLARVTATGRKADPAPASTSGDADADGIAIDWARARANLPLHYLENLETGGFVSENASPWAPESEAFVMTPELNAILQLDEGESDAVRNVLLDSRRNDTARRWAAPASIKAAGEGVTIEIAPAPPAAEASLRQSLTAIMGENRTDFFLQKVRSTLDWEYGGFGSLRRVVEVTVLPDNTLSIRESLRNAGGGQASATSPTFEIQSRQYRVPTLPSAIAALVDIEE